MSPHLISLLFPPQALPLPLLSLPASVASVPAIHPMKKEEQVLPIYVRGSHCLADLLPPGNDGQSAKFRQAPDHHLIVWWPVQKKTKRGKRRQKRV